MHDSKLTREHKNAAAKVEPALLFGFKSGRVRSSNNDRNVPHHEYPSNVNKIFLFYLLIQPGTANHPFCENFYVDCYEGEGGTEHLARAACSKLFRRNRGGTSGLRFWRGNHLIASNIAEDHLRSFLGDASK